MKRIMALFLALVLCSSILGCQAPSEQTQSLDEKTQKTKMLPEKAQFQCQDVKGELTFEWGENTCEITSTADGGRFENCSFSCVYDESTNSLDIWLITSNARGDEHRFLLCGYLFDYDGYVTKTTNGLMSGSRPVEDDRYMLYRYVDYSQDRNQITLRPDESNPDGWDESYSVGYFRGPTTGNVENNEVAFFGPAPNNPAFEVDQDYRFVCDNGITAIKVTSHYPSSFEKDPVEADPIIFTRDDKGSIQKIELVYTEFSVGEGGEPVEVEVTNIIQYADLSVAVTHNWQEIVQAIPMFYIFLREQGLSLAELYAVSLNYCK